MWLFSCSCDFSSLPGSLSEAPIIPYCTLLCTGSPFFLSGRTPLSLRGPWELFLCCTPGQALLTSTTFLLVIFFCLDRSSPDRFSYDHVCLSFQILPATHLGLEDNFLTRWLHQLPGLASILIPLVSAETWGEWPPPSVSGLTSPVLMVPSPPSTGTGLPILSPVPTVGAVKKELLGKMPLASLSPEEQTPSLSSRNLPLLSQLCEKKPNAHS